MSRILVIGGYGGFGGRLSRRLANCGHQVLVGGRSLVKARDYCQGRSNCEPVKIDRTRDLEQTIAKHRPDVVVDAAGPFQGSDFALPQACIESEVHYLDLADARDFVAGVAALEGAARRAGVAVIAGASSVPALSHAVVAQLAEGLDEVAAIEITISASSRASVGDSVAAAILGGVGQPLKLWRGRRWAKAFGWQSIRRERFKLPSGKSLGPRLVALADVPDLELLPGRIAGVSSVAFRAGTESALANLLLWASSWPIRWRWLESLAGAKAALLPLQRLTRLWGGDRSGMMVRLFGRAGCRRIERRWTLIAEAGDGPEIPVLAAAILADRIGLIPAGARDAGGLLTLDDFATAFTGLAIEHATIDIDQLEPLYRRVMGDDFGRLTPAVRRIHAVLRDYGASGEASVKGGACPLALLIARMMRFPPEGSHRLHVHFQERDGVETWTRDFAGHRFHSRLFEAGDGHIVEAFGPMRFYFTLQVRDGGLQMQLKRWSFGPLPLPHFLAPRIEAREWEQDERFHFDVAVALPLLGPVIHYRGWLLD